jgi:hypothetical protein
MTDYKKRSAQLRTYRDIIDHTTRPDDQYKRWERTDYLKNAVELMRDDKPELAAKLESLISSDRRAIKARVDRRTVEFLAQENARLMAQNAKLETALRQALKGWDSSIKNPSDFAIDAIHRISELIKVLDSEADHD